MTACSIEEIHNPLVEPDENGYRARDLTWRCCGRTVWVGNRLRLYIENYEQLHEIAGGKR